MGVGGVDSEMLIMHGCAKLLKVHRRGEGFRGVDSKKVHNAWMCEALKGLLQR